MLLHFDSKIVYFERILLYFQSALLDFDSILVVLCKYTCCTLQVYFCTLPQCLSKEKVVINVYLIFYKCKAPCCWGYHLRLFFVGPNPRFTFCNDSNCMLRKGPFWRKMSSWRNRLGGARFCPTSTVVCRVVEFQLQLAKCQLTVLDKPNSVFRKTTYRVVGK